MWRVCVAETLLCSSSSCSWSCDSLLWWPLNADCSITTSFTQRADAQIKRDRFCFLAFCDIPFLCVPSSFSGSPLMRSLFCSSLQANLHPLPPLLSLQRPSLPSLPALFQPERCCCSLVMRLRQKSAQGVQVLFSLLDFGSVPSAALTPPWWTQTQPAAFSDILSFWDKLKQHMVTSAC